MEQTLHLKGIGSHGDSAGCRRTAGGESSQRSAAVPWPAGRPHSVGERGLTMTELFISGEIVAALEQAAVAVGRLDAALAANPLRRAWTFRGELDAARRHAGADGRRV